jgi:hypothetical protein
VVEEIGRAAGVTYQDNEPLKFGERPLSGISLGGS